MRPAPHLSLNADPELSRDVRQGTATLLDALERVAARVDERTWLSLAEAAAAIADEEPHAPPPAELAGLVGAGLSTTERLAAVLDGVTRDFHRRDEILADALTTAQVARRLRLSRQGPHDRRAQHRLLGVPHNRDWLFPAWQLDPRTRDGVVRGLPDVLQALAPMDPWDQAFWLTSARPELDGRTPIEAVRDGEVDVVARLARATAER